MPMWETIPLDRFGGQNKWSIWSDWCVWTSWRTWWNIGWFMAHLKLSRGNILLVKVTLNGEWKWCIKWCSNGRKPGTLSFLISCGHVCHPSIHPTDQPLGFNHLQFYGLIPHDYVSWQNEGLDVDDVCVPTLRPHVQPFTLKGKVAKCDPAEKEEKEESIRIKRIQRYSITIRAYTLWCFWISLRSFINNKTSFSSSGLYHVIYQTESNTNNILLNIHVRGSNSMKN